MRTEFDLFDSGADSEHSSVDLVKISNIFGTWDDFFNGKAPFDRVLVGRLDDLGSSSSIINSISSISPRSNVTIIIILPGQLLVLTRRFLLKTIGRNAVHCLIRWSLPVIGVSEAILVKLSRISPYLKFNSSCVRSKYAISPWNYLYNVAITLRVIEWIYFQFLGKIYLVILSHRILEPKW